MYYETCAANDGCTLAFQTSIPLNNPSQTPTPAPNTLILLLHGFSGSSAYFTRNFAALSGWDPDTHYGSPTPRTAHWVVAPDMRGHGQSGRPSGGYHVARLAADLHDLIDHLRRKHAAMAPGTNNLQIVAIGCSIGAAILWTYIELYGGCSDFAGFVFVDQAPLQDALWFSENDEDNWGPDKHHKGCYDEQTLTSARKAWMLPYPEMNATYEGLVNECLGYRQPNDNTLVTKVQCEIDEAFFADISAQCDGKWLGRLMADHTRNDHREAIEMIDLPTLVMAGEKSGCFPLQGMLETARRIKKARRESMKGKVAISVFESGHWLFYEDAKRFNREVLEFVDDFVSG